jgi:predicted nucleic acid-binding protein
MPEMIIVNTSPIFYLHRLGLLEILNKLYGDITIPEAVRNELEKGLIPALKPVIEKLLSLNFRLKPDLVNAILELAGE